MLCPEKWSSFWAIYLQQIHLEAFSDLGTCFFWNFGFEKGLVCHGDIVFLIITWQNLDDSQDFLIDGVCHDFDTHLLECTFLKDDVHQIRWFRYDVTETRS